ncbi:MAG: hypothetical protein R2716_05845 [Microthrixaceae bacterium]
MAASLYVDYCGEERVVEPPGRLSFGRSADLVIDDNPYMHRVLGVLELRSGHWVLTNAGRSTVLNLADRTGPSAAVVAPGRSIGLTMEEFSISFVAGRTRYELDAYLEGLEEPDGVERPGGGGQRTLEWGVVDLNDEQRALLVDLARSRLADPHAPDWAPDAKAACARRLGWSLSKYRRKLDHLCEKLDRAGVPGLIGAEGDQAANRRRLLVEHALTVGLVGNEDLGQPTVTRG